VDFCLWDEHKHVVWSLSKCCSFEKEEEKGGNLDFASSAEGLQRFKLQAAGDFNEGSLLLHFKWAAPRDDDARGCSVFVTEFHMRLHAGFINSKFGTKY